MRIAVLGNAQSPHTTRWAKAYAERGHEVYLLSIRSTQIEDVESVVFRFGSKDAGGRRRALLSYFLFLLRARGVLQEIAPDVVHAHYSVTHGVIALAAGVRPIVLSVWGSDVVGPHGPVSFPLRMINRMVLPRVDLVTATSRFMIPFVHDLAGRSIRVEHVPFGVDSTVFPPRMGSRDGAGHRIGFVKHLKQKYGPSYLLEAFPRVLARYPDATLTFAGSGPLEASLRERAHALGVDAAVDFLGRVPHERVPELIRSFDVLVNPSVFESESFGVVLLEGMSSGVPVVATDVGGVSEVIDHGEDGLLVTACDPAPIADAILSVLDDPSLRERLIEGGLRKVHETYSWDRSVESMVALFIEPRQPQLP